MIEDARRAPSRGGALLTLALTALVVSGCGDGLGPLGAASVELGYRMVRVAEAASLSVEAHSGTGEVTVDGVIALQGCGGLEGRVSRRGSTVELRITARSSGCGFRSLPGPIPVLMGFPFAYEAVVHDLVPGLYLLRVIHIEPDWGSEIVLEEEVVVG